MNTKVLILAGVLAALSFNSSAQNFVEALGTFDSRNPQEKIFIHFDKDSYVAGETIWFKAYLASNGMPSMLSTNFYMSLSDEKGKIISMAKYPVNGASVKGQIDLADSIAQGAYILSAYTATTINYTDENLLYRKGFFIYNPMNKKPAAQQSSISLQFFPESGHLIHGITTSVAFKVVDQDGRPFNGSGMVKTADGFTIPFTTIHNGMGKISFRPDASKTYTATMANYKQEFSLPAVEKSGINLHVEDESSGKLFSLTRSTADKNNFQKIFLVAQINNQVVYEQDIDFEDYPTLKGHLVTDKLPSGILHFTVFNKDGIPLAERLSFVDNREYISDTRIESPMINLKKRGENTIEIHDNDSLQKSLSVSIVEASAMDEKDRESIVSNFLLTADLRGYVYNPAWYFEQPRDSVKKPLDLLMMTHGWTRFNWKKLVSGTFAGKKMDDPYLLTVKGIVRDDKGKEMMGGKLNLYIESEDSTTQSYEVDVSSTGTFMLDSLLFYGNSKFYYNYINNGRQKPALVILDSLDTDPLLSLEAWPGVLPYTTVELTPAEAEKRYKYKKESPDRSKELETIVLETTSKKKPVDLVNEKYTSGAFRTPSKINLDNITAPTPNKTINPLDYAMNNIRQLELQNGRLVNNRTMSLQSGSKWTVAVFLDETPSELSALRTYRMDEIALIKYYEPGFVGAGSNGPGGALAVYTKHSKQDKPKNVPMDHVIYKGYSVTKDFYNPDYSKPEAKHSQADNRTTLYWNPEIYLDAENQKIPIRFFNNDYSKKLKIVIEGFSADGKLVHIEKTIE